VKLGDELEVVVTAENMHFFDHDTHNAIWT